MAQFDVEYDVLVVGSGGSGKSAAYTVASESDLSVAIIEKLPDFGGTSMFAEGQAAAESIEQKERKVPFDITGEGLPEDAHFPTRTELAKAYMKASHFRAVPDVVNAFVDNSGDTIEFLRNLGVEYEYVSNYSVGQDDELYCFHLPKGAGMAVQEVLQRACENAGVDMFASTPAKELIFEDGEIVGMLATDADGNEMRIGAKAIILATGGYAQSREKLGKYSWMPWIGETVQFPFPFLQNTGDGLDMAISAGADISACGAVQTAASALGKLPGSGCTGAGFQPALWVNSKGKRYCSEEVALSLMDTGVTFGTLKDGVNWTVFDEDHLVYLETEGSDVAMGEFITINKPALHIRPEIEECFSQGDPVVAKADTIEELAQQMGVPAENLQATIDEYNGFCDAGEDKVYHKSAKYLHPVRTAPFYAVHMRPVVICSAGGASVNANMQVVDYDGNPVCGGNLYTVGNDAAGMYGDTYIIDCPGSTNGFAHTSGRIAARHAIKQIQG